jgi:PKD repeat protein
MKIDDEPVYVSGNWENTSEGFTGHMDEVRLWAKALTAEEIKQVKGKELIGNESGLIYYLRFNLEDRYEADGLFYVTDHAKSAGAHARVNTQGGSRSNGGSVYIADSRLGKAVFIPGDGVSGSDSFTFKVFDGLLSSTAALVSVEVTANANRSPTLASIGDRSVVVGSALSLSLSGSDADGDALAYSMSTSPAGALLSGAAFTWTPSSNDVGKHTATFVVSDGKGGSATETITITVTNAVAAQVDSLSTPACSSAAPRPLFAASSSSGDIPFTVTFTDTTKGEVTSRRWDWGDAKDPVNTTEPATTHTYSVAGSYSVTLTVENCGGSNSLTKPAYLQALGQPIVDLQQPAERIDFGRVEVGQSHSLIIVLTNAGRKEARVQYASLVGSENSVITLSDEKPRVAGQSTTELRLTFAPVTARVYDIVLQLDFGNDGVYETRLAGVGVIEPRAPLAQSVTATVAEDDILIIELAATDADGDALRYTIANRPAHGSVTLQDQRATYTPNANFNGVDAFSFVASDGGLTSNEAEVSLTVLSVNDPPSALQTRGNTTEDQSVVIQLLGDDVDGDALLYGVREKPEHGVVTVSGSLATYQPDPNYHGQDRFTYVVSDGTAQSLNSPVAIEVGPVNDRPTATGARDTTVLSGQTINIVLGADDADGDRVRVSLDEGPAKMDLLDDRLTWRPRRRDVGLHSVKVTMTDGQGGVNEVSFAIDVINAPYLEGDFSQDGRVDFIDFFLFADAFGTNDVLYDFDDSGRVDFSDFFVFADLFGAEERAKLLVMARDILGLPTRPGLGEIYPNPFNHEVRIPYTLPSEAVIEITVYDVAGQLVRRLVNGRVGPGAGEVGWSGIDKSGRLVSAGVYLVVLRSGDVTSTKKALFLK